MKMRHYNGLCAAAILVLVCENAPAQDDTTNRFTVSARFGLNISAKFGPRRTPDKMSYDHLDGYALTDISGNFGGQTWNWGYDNSANQIVGNDIVMTRPSSSTPLSSGSFDSDPNYGLEVGYSRKLTSWKGLHFGVEAAGSYMRLALNNDASFSGIGAVDSYAYTPGTTPPQSPVAGTGQPYQGSFAGPGFVINVPPVTSSAMITAVQHQKFDADLWGLRLGPYVEIPLGSKFSFWLGGGLAVALIDGTATWSQSVAIGSAAPSTASGSGSDNDALWGGYVGGNLTWQMNDHWSAVAGAQWQDVGKYQQVLGGRQVEVDLRNAIYLTIGLGYSF